jgi:long-chain acyl-CoA synthetase
MAKLGGKMRLSVSGGAPLGADVARTFIGLGLTISQGYGMTELSPVVSTNKLDDNDPVSVGQPLRDVNIKLSDNDELCVRSPGIMLGYWNNEQATKEIIDDDGWLHTGDKAKIVDDHIYITGRIKEILVLSTGEKVPPADIELAIAQDPLFEQTIVIGEQKPFLAAIVVFNEDEWKKLTRYLNIEASNDSLNSERIIKYTLDRIQKQLHDFPGYANIYKITITLEPWTVENNMLTPTLKLKRDEIMQYFNTAIVEMYKGH